MEETDVTETQRRSPDVRGTSTETQERKDMMKKGTDMQMSHRTGEVTRTETEKKRGTKTEREERKGTDRSMT